MRVGPSGVAIRPCRPARGVGPDEVNGSFVPAEITIAVAIAIAIAVAVAIAFPGSDFGAGAAVDPVGGDEGGEARVGRRSRHLVADGPPPPAAAAAAASVKLVISRGHRR